MPCEVNDKYAVVMPDERVLEFEISGRTLIKRIREITHWEGNTPRMCYGEYMPMHQAVIFDLTRTEKLEVMEAAPADLGVRGTDGKQE